MYVYTFIPSFFTLQVSFMRGGFDNWDWGKLGVSAFSALSGGIGEAVGGGKFWEGVSKGAIIGAANHGLHMGAKALFGGPEKGVKANKNNNTLKSFRAVETGGKYSGYADAGREIAQETRILKYQSKIINNSFKWSGFIGDGAGFFVDSYDFANDNISGSEFGLNMSQRVFSTVVGAVYGPVAGVGADLSITTIRETIPVIQQQSYQFNIDFNYFIEGMRNSFQNQNIIGR